MNNKERARLVDALGSAIADGETSLGQVPQLLRKILENDAWKEFETSMGKHVTYTRFEDFVFKPPLDGLGANLDLVKEIVSGDIELQKLLAKALRDTHGGDRKSETAKEEIKKSTGLFDFREIEEKPKKKQDQYGKRILHLERKAPELYAQVVAGEKTVYAASIEAKIDHPTMTVTLDSPKSAQSLVAKASPEFLDELRRLLNS
jgi:hypothetical protein